MADADIRRLCAIYDELPPEDVQAMEPQLSSILNPMVGVSDDDPVYGSIKAIRDDRARLVCMATFYSWLLPRSPQTLWALYSVHRISSVLDAPQIALQLARKVKSADKSATGSCSNEGNAWCSTIMTTQGARAPSKYIPISINVWYGLPFVAIHIQDMAGPDLANWPLLACVVGNLAKCCYGLYSSLASARSAAASALQDQSE